MDKKEKRGLILIMILILLSIVPMFWGYGIYSDYINKYNGSDTPIVNVIFSSNNASCKVTIKENRIYKGDYEYVYNGHSSSSNSGTAAYEWNINNNVNDLKINISKFNSSMKSDIRNAISSYNYSRDHMFLFNDNGSHKIKYVKNPAENYISDDFNGQKLTVKPGDIELKGDIITINNANYKYNFVSCVSLNEGDYQLIDGIKVVPSDPFVFKQPGNMKNMTILLELYSNNSGHYKGYHFFIQISPDNVIDETEIYEYRF
ncbi:MAG: hypothetical protein LBU40_04190 [Methanobrevibacter sp.]|jgi:hypothetical protein|nr:hypothetical protein [Methanobrevibacter sp.]